MNEKIVIAGGSGFIGQELIKYFGKENDIVVLSRQEKNARNNRNDYTDLSETDLRRTRYVKWDGKTYGDWAKELEGAGLLINLSGQSVNCRYTKKNKKKIFDSRTDSTKILGWAIQQAVKPPLCWMNAASATIYPHDTGKPQDESNTVFHDDFSVQVCKLWEKTFHEQSTPKTRKIVLRMAINLGAGGILKPFFNLLKFGLGGKQGSGKQMMSWIHVEDNCRMIHWIYEHPELSGTFNCCSPQPVSNKEFMRTLRRSAGHVFGLPAFSWMIRIGTFLIGTEPELVLKSRWVLPTRILQTGFQFRFETLNKAFSDILQKVPRKQYHLF